MSIYLKEFSTHAEYENYINGSNAILPNVSICTTEGDVHYYPYVDPCKSEKVKTTYEWVEIGGVKWATKNVGAKTITNYGQYFSWGGVNGFTADQVTGDCHSKAFTWNDYELGSFSDITKYYSGDSKTVLEASDDAATVNMGSGWRMPTSGEMQSLIYNTTTAWTTSYNGSGVAGLVCTDNTDSSKKLFFPAAGCCISSGVKFMGAICLYWSSSLYKSSYVQDAQYLHFNYVGGGMNNEERRCGLPVRGVVG